VFRTGNQVLPGLAARGVFTVGSRSRRRNRLLYVRRSLYYAIVSHLTMLPFLDPIDNIVWQYNVILARATSDALDAS
jgi:hypothetical protein